MPKRRAQFTRRGTTLKPVDAEIFAHLNTEELADLAGVNVATARRWKAACKLPETVKRLLEITALGRLDVLGWRGWRLIRGELISPEGWQFKPGDVMSLQLLRMQVRGLEAERRAFLNLDAQPESQHDAPEILQRISRAV